MFKLGKQKTGRSGWLLPDSGGGPQIAVLTPSQDNFGRDQKLETDSWHNWEDLTWGEGNMISKRKSDIWSPRGIRDKVWASVKLAWVGILTLPLKNCRATGNSLIYSNLSLPIWKIKTTLHDCFKDDMLVCSTDKRLAGTSLNKI